MFKKYLGSLNQIAVELSSTETGIFVKELRSGIKISGAVAMYKQGQYTTKVVRQAVFSRSGKTYLTDHNAVEINLAKKLRSP